MKVVILAAALTGCGHAGGASGGGGGGVNGPPVVSPNVREVTGQFFVGTAATPAAGYEIWMFDHTGVTYTRTILDDSGAFAMPIQSFVEGHEYSLHLVRNFLLVGDVSLAASTPGARPTFVYQGGYGFDLGQVVVPLDQHGVPSGAGGLPGHVGGGFNLNMTATATFASFPMPSSLASVQAGSQLIVADAETALYSFYNRAQHADLYARDLQRLSRLGFVTLAASGSTISRAFVLEAGDWLTTARLPTAPDDTPETSPLWSTVGTNLVQIDPTHFENSVFLSGLPQAATVLSLRVEPVNGQSVAVPTTLPRLVTVPPEVMAIGAAGQAPAAIDYTSATAPNGLTLPVCQNSDVTLVVAPPLDGTGAPIPATVLPRVDVFVDFYTSQGGQTVPLDVPGAQLPAPYNAANTDTSVPDAQRDWDPAQLMMRFTLGPSQTGQATQSLVIPAALLPGSVAAGSITAVRLRIVYGSDAEATRGGTLVWLTKSGC